MSQHKNKNKNKNKNNPIPPKTEKGAEGGIGGRHQRGGRRIGPSATGHFLLFYLFLYKKFSHFEPFLDIFTTVLKKDI